MANCLVELKIRALSVSGYWSGVMTDFFHQAPDDACGKVEGHEHVLLSGCPRVQGGTNKMS